MDEYPKHITVGGQTYEVQSAEEEATYRGVKIASSHGTSEPEGDDVPAPDPEAHPDPDADEAPDLDESAEPDAPVRKKPGPKGGKKK